MVILVRNESFKEFITLYPITTIIVFLNTIMFLYTSLIGGLTKPEILYDLGGISLEYIQKNEYYRLILSAFIHDGFMHFIINIGLIIITAPPIESMLKKISYLIFFLLTVLGCSFLVVLFNGDVGVGSSGFGYGILGFYLALIIFRKDIIDKESRIIILLITSAGMILSIINENISLLGHIGGFGAGFLYSLIFQLTYFRKNISRNITKNNRRV